MAVWGDTIDRPVLGIACKSWPDFRDFLPRTLEDPVHSIVPRRQHSKFGAGSIGTIWAMSFKFQEYIQQSNYWAAQVSRFRAEALIPPRILGRRSIWMRNNRTDQILETTIFGPEYNKWIEPSRELRPISVPLLADEIEAWEVENQMKLRQNVIQAALTREEADVLQNQLDMERVKKWEIQRDNHPVPVETNQIAASVLRAALRESELTQAESAINAKYGISTDRGNLRREKLRKGLIQDGIRYYHQRNYHMAFAYLSEVCRLTQSRLFRPRARALLGMLPITKERREHLQYALNAFRVFEAEQIPLAPGSWREWILEIEEALAQLNREALIPFKEQYDREQEVIDACVKALYANKQQDAAFWASSLLTGRDSSKFTAIRAQAHIILARMHATPDKAAHCQEARSRLLKLMLLAPDERDWGEMMDVVDHIESPPFDEWTSKLKSARKQSDMMLDAWYLVNNSHAVPLHGPLGTDILPTPIMFEYPVGSRYGLELSGTEKNSNKIKKWP